MSQLASCCLGNRFVYIGGIRAPVVMTTHVFKAKGSGQSKQKTKNHKNHTIETTNFNHIRHCWKPQTRFADTPLTLPASLNTHFSRSTIFPLQSLVCSPRPTIGTSLACLFVRLIVHPRVPYPHRLLHPSTSPGTLIRACCSFCYQLPGPPQLLSVPLSHLLKNVFNHLHRFAYASRCKTLHLQL